MSQVNVIAVLGAGNGGQTMAADLTLSGFKVNLFELPAFSSNLKPLKLEGGLHLSGVGHNGFAKLNKITDNIEEALTDADLVMIACAVEGHEPMMEAAVRYLKDSQVVVFNTGYWAGLRFADLLKKHKSNVVIAETSILLYLCVIEGPAKVRIDGIKNEVPFAAFPSKHNQYVHDIIKNVIPNFVLGNSILDVNLNNINWIFHPAILLMNLALIERTGGDFTFYREGVTPRVGRLVDKIDEERVAIGKAYGLNLEPVHKWLSKFYGAEGTNMYDSFHSCKAYEPSRYVHVLKNLDKSNFITEDVTYGLVSVASLAEVAGIQTPTINALVDIANAINMQDYRANGITMNKLGLAGLNVNQISRVVHEGF
jgi:opine dehydrogenase